MEKGKVSFIIVNWNGEKTIAECLDSVYSQTYKNYEVILLDNHSSDQSLEIIKKNYHVDKLIAFEKNYGFAEANNRGLKHAEGEYLALINNDTVLEKDWLEKAVSVFKDSPDKNLGSVATKIIHYHTAASRCLAPVPRQLFIKKKSLKKLVFLIRSSLFILKIRICHSASGFLDTPAFMSLRLCLIITDLGGELKKISFS